MMVGDDRVETILDRLSSAYPDSTISLRFSTRLELLVAVVLSAQCTDKRVNTVTETLFEKYATPAEYAEADLDELADDIYPVTYYNQKASYLKRACERIIEDHGGRVPDTMEELTALPGVGRKTAHVVLQHGHDVVEGIVVDTHVHRLSRRLGLTNAATPRAIERDLVEVVPEDRWVQFTHLLIDHGRAVCTARSPDCDACVIEPDCPSSRLRENAVDLATGEAWD